MAISEWQQFENDFCNYLAEQGYWVYHIPKKKDGSQPFDVLAVKNGVVAVYDCKVLHGDRFPLSRIEWNQRYGFAQIQSKGGVAVIKADSGIYEIPYVRLQKRINEGESSIKVTDYEICRIK